MGGSFQCFLAECEALNEKGREKFGLRFVWKKDFEGRRLVGCEESGLVGEL